MAFLTAENGIFSGLRHPLDKARHILGRHPECDIVVEAGAVSRHHAQVLKVDEDFFVEDMHSRNGTYVNDQLIFGRHRLKEGDRIRVCDVTFSFHHDGTTLPDGSQAVLIDEGPQSNASTIMSKLDVSSNEGNLRYNSTPEVKLKALVEITKNLGRTLAVDQVLPQVLSSLFKIFVQADRGFIVLRNAEGELVPRCTHLRRENSTEPLRLSRTILQEAIRSKQAILSADAASDQRFETSESVADFRIRSLMCAPLLDNENDVIGVIQIDTVDQRSRFRQEDLDVLVSVAIQAAVAIDNAQLHERLLEQKALARDLELAREVQTSFLPQRPPQRPDFDFFDFYSPANHIGGDYYDYIPLSDDRFAIVVADVVGHGIAAALQMSQLSATLRFCFASEQDPAIAVRRLNHAMTPESFDGRFITLVAAIIDPHREELTVVNAGHLPPIIKRSDGSVETSETTGSGIPLLIDADEVYRPLKIPFGVGDCLILYTDGLTEATNADDELFGIERLEASLREAKDGPLGPQLLARIQEFVQNRPAKDDMCLVCCHRRTAAK